MKFIFFLLLTILVVVAGVFLKLYPATVLITLPNWSVESPLWFAIISLLIVFVALHYLIRIAIFIRNISPNWKKRNALKKTKKMLAVLESALCAFLKDDWCSAGKYFKQAAAICPDFPEAKAMADRCSLQKNKPEEKIYTQAIEKPFNDFEALERTWDDFPRAAKKDQAVFFAYAKAALLFEKDNEILKPLINAIDKKWDGKLVALFGQLKSSDQNKLLKIAEKWLKNHPHDTDLLLTLVQITLRLKLWGKAEFYLKEAIKIDPSAKAYQLLGSLHECMGDKQAALDAYKKALVYSA